MKKREDTSTQFQLNLGEQLRAYKVSHAVAIAISMGLLEATVNCPGTSLAIAERCDLDSEYAEILLRILCHAGLLEARGSDYHPTHEGRRATSEDGIRALAGYHAFNLPAWAALADCARSGTGGSFHRAPQPYPRFHDSYMHLMEALATHNLSSILDRCRALLKGRIIDVGAGPSTVCRRLAEGGAAEVTALDLPHIVKVSKRLFRYPMNRFFWVADDFRNYEAIERFDGLFCGHLLEYCPRHDLNTWLSKLRSFLRTPAVGVFIVFLRSPEHDLELDLFRLSTGVAGESLGYICTKEELQTCLTNSGASQCDFVPLPTGVTYPEHLVTCVWDD